MAMSKPYIEGIIEKLEKDVEILKLDLENVSELGKIVLGNDIARIEENIEKWKERLENI